MKHENVIEINKLWKAHHPNRAVFNRIVTKRLLNPFHLRSARYTLHPGEQFVLKGIDLEVRKGERVGILSDSYAMRQLLTMLLCEIGAPDLGTIHLREQPILFINTKKIFKPMLTVSESVHFGASLFGSRFSSATILEVVEFAGLQGLEHQALYDVDASKLVELFLSIQLFAPARLSIFNNIFQLGEEPFRSRVRDKIIERITNNTSVLISDWSNRKFLEESCDRVFFLEGGHLFQNLEERGMHQNSEELNVVFGVADDDEEEGEGFDSEQSTSPSVEFSDLLINGMSPTRILLNNEGQTEIRVSFSLPLSKPPKLVEVGLSLATSTFLFSSRTLSLNAQEISSSPCCISFRVNVPSLQKGLYQLTCRLHLDEGFSQSIKLCELASSSERRSLLDLEVETLSPAEAPGGAPF